MREIKFRQWIRSMKFFHYWGFTENGIFVNPIGMMLNDKRESMQFTGLKDKSGREIYEGDILRVFDINGDYFYVGEVYYSERYGEFSFVGANSLSWYLINKNYFRIMGNIYENKELLEEIK